MSEITAPVYTFRNLKSTDMFLMFKIIGKIGVNEFTACFDKDTVKKMIATAKGKNDNAAQVVGMSVMLEMANVITNNLAKCETEIYQLLSDVSGMAVKEIEDMDFVTFTEMVLDFIMKDEFRDFVKVVSKRFKLAK